jgi:hypothetical protein
MDLKTVISTWAVCALAGASVHAANIVIDDFEGSEGHFTSLPSTSGTTTGETETAPSIGPSTADLDTTVSISGISSQRIFLDDDPSADVPSTNPVQAWRLRHLSGGGTPANNLSFVASGYVGFYLRTATPDLQASIFIDDGAALERASYIPIIGDGAWHLYQWNLDDDTQWEAFAGTTPNGIIDSATVTIDGIFVNALKTSGDQDAIFNLDYVVANPDGLITPVPEPASGMFFAFCGAVAILHSRRRR